MRKSLLSVTICSLIAQPAFAGTYNVGDHVTITTTGQSGTVAKVDNVSKAVYIKLDDHPNWDPIQYAMSSENLKNGGGGGNPAALGPGGGWNQHPKWNVGDRIKLGSGAMGVVMAVNNAIKSMKVLLDGQKSPVDVYTESDYNQKMAGGAPNGGADGAQQAPPAFPGQHVGGNPNLPPQIQDAPFQAPPPVGGALTPDVVRQLIQNALTNPSQIANTAGLTDVNIRNAGAADWVKADEYGIPQGAQVYDVAAQGSYLLTNRQTPGIQTTMQQLQHYLFWKDPTTGGWTYTLVAHPGDYNRDPNNKYGF